MSRLYDLLGIRPSGHSHPIAPEEQRRQLFATLCFVNPDGEVEYGRELPIEQEFGWRDLPPEPDCESRRVWIGFEVHTSDKALRRATLVIATYPYSTDWFDWADFKSVLNRSRAQRMRPLRKPQDEVKLLFRSIHRCGHELLETRSGWFTARLSLPTRTVDLALAYEPDQADIVRKAFQSTLNRRYYRSDESDLWCYGVCPEFERCRELLRVSPEAIRVLQETEDGDLFKKRKRGGSAPFRKIGAEAKHLRHAVLESSIIKALAGNSPKLDSISKRGKPPLAALVMAEIYEEAMYNLVKRLKETVVGSKIQPTNMEATFAAPEAQEIRTFDEMIEFFRQGLQTREPDESARLQVERWLTSEDARDRMAACAALAGAHKAGYRPLRSFNSLLERTSQDQREDPVVQRAARFTLTLMRKGDPPDH